MKVLLFGGSGFIGGLLCRKLLAEPSIDKLICPLRQQLNNHSELAEDRRLSLPVIDFQGMPASLFQADIDWLLLCLGSHSGSRGSYRQVDYGYTVAAARRARAAGVNNCLLISSTLASVHSLSRYLRCKGEAEQTLEALNFDRLGIMQPGPLTGRPALRWSEKLGTPLMSLVAKLSGGVRSPIAPIAGQQVAEFMLRQVVAPEFTGVKRFSTADMLGV